MTRHLNLRWTVGDMDRLAFARRNASRMTIDEMCAALQDSRLSCTRQKMTDICNAFGVSTSRKLADVMGDQ